ncbi:MAG: hypothetical protein WCG91_00785 [Candidatus Shapirobacteria bacterium]
MKKLGIAKFLVIALVLGGGLIYGTQMVQKNQENRSKAAEYGKTYNNGDVICGVSIPADWRGLAKWKLPSEISDAAVDEFENAVFKCNKDKCTFSTDSIGDWQYLEFCGPVANTRKSCQEINGVNASCKNIEGACASKLNTCQNGKFKDTADTPTEYKWNCEGVSILGGTTSGTTASCSIKKQVCGANRNTCKIGKYSKLDDTNNQYKWKCNTTVCLKDKAPLCGVYAFDGKPIKTASCYVGSLDRPNFGLAIYDVTINGKKYKAWYCKNGSSKVSCTNKTPSINY